MKKYIILMLTIITMQTHSMETTTTTMDLWRLPTDALDLIAQSFSFHDIETEKEFIKRTEKLQSLDTKKTPGEYTTLVPFNNIKHCVYCPNNAIIAVLQDTHTWKGEKACKNPPLPKLVIINKKDNQQQIHNFGEQWDTKYSELAISRDGNVVAAIHSERDFSRRSRHEVMYYKDVVAITNLSTKQTEQHDADSRATIAFNKQGTNVILHHFVFPSIPTIIPVTVNSSNTNIQPHKTLAKYFAQQGICKDLLGQLQTQKMNARKALQ